MLNFNILRTFCNNLAKYFEAEPSDCCKVLQRLAREALNPETLHIQAVDRYMDEFAFISTPKTLMRISVWPTYEPVVGTYDDRKEFLIKCWDAQGKPKPTMPPIYTPQLVSDGGVRCWWKTLEDSKPTEVPFQSIPQKISESKHFQRVLTIVQSKSGDYCLYHDQTDPTTESNWVYYIIMIDPTVSPEAADQGYIGQTTNTLLTRIKQHTRPEDMIIHYNLALLSQFLQQRGEDLSDYVAVFALGTTMEKELCRKMEGKLIRESLEGFSVADMKYGMNCKQGSAANKQHNEQDIQSEGPNWFKSTGKLQVKREAEIGSETSHGEFSEERHRDMMSAKIRHGEKRQISEIRRISGMRQISEIKNQEMKMRHDEDSETRQGEDTDMRHTGESGVRYGDSAARYGQDGQESEMGNEEDSEMQDSETRYEEDSHEEVAGIRKIQYGDSEARHGEDVEMMQCLEMRNGESGCGEDSEMRNGEDSETGNGQDSETGNGEDSETGYEEDSETGNGEDSEMEDSNGGMRNCSEKGHREDSEMEKISAEEKMKELLMEELARQQRMIQKRNEE